MDGAAREVKRLFGDEDRLIPRTEARRRWYLPLHLPIP